MNKTIEWKLKKPLNYSWNEPFSLNYKIVFHQINTLQICFILVSFMLIKIENDNLSKQSSWTISNVFMDTCKQ